VTRTALGHSQNEIKLARLDYIDVKVNGIEHAVPALVDGGSQLNVIDASLIKTLGLTPVGTILIRGIIGEPVRAELVKLHVRLAACGLDAGSHASVNEDYITVICAVCENLNDSLTITLPAADQLYSLMQSDYVNLSEHGNEFVNCHTYEMPYEHDGFVAVTTRSLCLFVSSFNGPSTQRDH
jgi:Aspartyl protease